MTKLIELIAAISNLVDAHTTEMRCGTQRMFASLLAMGAVFILAIGGLAVAGIGAYMLLAPVMSPGGAALLLGGIILLIAAMLFFWIKANEHKAG